MEKKYQSLTLFAFQERFLDSESCLRYLSEEKWKNGFVCTKCGHTHYFETKDRYSRQCTKCRHTESPTAGTLFHRMKFPILKAFYIVYYVATSKSGISSTELSRKLGLRQKTCWLFKQKVIHAMKSSGRYPITGQAELDESVVGGQEEVHGRKNQNKKLIAIAIEHKGKGVSRMHGKVITKADNHQLDAFMESCIDRKACIKTDKWIGYTPLKEKFVNLHQEDSGKKGRNFPDMHRTIMGFKKWLRGIHHHVEHLQAYIDEYTYRFNRSFMKEGIFENLINRMIKACPYPYKMIRE